jgi:hypothetical protein
MRRIRNVVAAVSIAAALGAAGAGAAQAATLTVDHPCYYSFGRAHEKIVLTVTGFKPGVQVNLTFLGQTFHTNGVTDAAGRIQASFPAPQLRGTRARVPITASDGTNTATTSFYLTDVKADFNPSSGAPGRLKVRFTVTGLGAVLAFLHRDPHGSVFAHYIRPNGRVKGTRQFGHLSGPCGDLRTSKTRLLPYGSEVGLWKVYFDTNRSYKKREIAQLVVGFNVTRVLVRR